MLSGQKNASVFFPRVSYVLFLSSLLQFHTFFFSIFSGALTCSWPPAGMVDLSDVRSMSRPVSPLSVFPSPCIIRPRNERATRRAHTHTLAHQECCPHSGENANARMAVVVLKENDPGRQAPSTRQGQGGQRRDKQTAYSPHRSLPHDPPPPFSLSLTFHSFSMSLSPSVHPNVPNLGWRNGPSD